MPRGSESRLTLTILLSVSVVLLVLDARGGADPVTQRMRSAGEAVFTPLTGAVSTVASPLERFSHVVAAAPGAATRIAELESENARLTAELRERERAADRSQELDGLMRLAGLGGYEIVPAQAVTRVSAQGYADTITLDVGRNDGVEADMTVLNEKGLVGRVVHAHERTATVLLVSDRSSAVGARVAGSQEIGLVKGQAHTITEPAGLRFEPFDAAAEIPEGEHIVSLGSHDGVPFVPGVPIGTVERVEHVPGELSRVAELRPAVDTSRLDIVGVVVAAPDDDPRDAVLPPEPDEAENADEEIDREDS